MACRDHVLSQDSSHLKKIEWLVIGSYFLHASIKEKLVMPKQNVSRCHKNSEHLNSKEPTPEST